MPVDPTYPGVYIEEIPSGVRTIVGVATSVTAFIGYFPRGSMDDARRVLDFAEFEREFGGLHRDSEASYAIEQFFLNGGRQALIARAAAGRPVSAAVVLEENASDPGLLRVEGANPGRWGERLWVEVDHATSNKDETFDLTVSELGDDAAVVSQEVSATSSSTPPGRTTWSTSSTPDPP